MLPWGKLLFIVYTVVFFFFFFFLLLFWQKRNTVSLVIHSINSQSLKEEIHPKLLGLGPVVQSIVSLTSSLRGQLVKCSMIF